MKGSRLVLLVVFFVGVLVGSAGRGLLERNMLPESQITIPSGRTPLVQEVVSSFDEALGDWVSDSVMCKHGDVYIDIACLVNKTTGLCLLADGRLVMRGNNVFVGEESIVTGVEQEMLQRVYTLQKRVMMERNAQKR